MSLCNRPNSSTSLLALILFKRRMNARLVMAVTFSAEGSTGCMSPVSRTSRLSRDDWLLHLSHRSSETRDKSGDGNGHWPAWCWPHWEWRYIDWMGSGGNYVTPVWSENPHLFPSPLSIYLGYTVWYLNQCTCRYRQVLKIPDHFDRRGRLVCTRSLSPRVQTSVESCVKRFNTRY